MTRRFGLIGLCLLLGVTGCVPSPDEATSDRPNIVYILADDLGYGDVGVNNPESKIPTPNIDRLASQGMRFTDAHSPSSVCTPTRYAILTGRYCWRSRLPAGVLRGYGQALIEPGRLTVPRLLQEQGYETGIVGKWHLGLDWVLKPGYADSVNTHTAQINEFGIVREMNPDWIDFAQPPTDGPLAHGFDYSFILPASLDMPPYCYLENDTLLTAPTAYTPGNDLNTGYTEAFWRAGAMAPGFQFEEVLPTFTQKAEAFIANQADADAPFFLYLALAAPHTPWVPTEAFEGTSDAGTYGDFVHMVDAAVGRIMDSLREHGLDHNTVLIFTSDNGPYWRPDAIERFQHQAAHIYRGMKADIWEGGHRVPYLVRWPARIAPGTQSAYTTTLTHLMATSADILGIELPDGAGEDSHSILPALVQDTAAAEPVPVVHHSSRAYFAIRDGDWKLIEGRGSGGFSEPVIVEPEPGEPPGQLYNLAEDPSETRNLYDEQPELVARLKQHLKALRAP